MNFNFPDFIELAHLPTPIEKLPRLSKQFEGPVIYIKRDDYTGLALSGNKVRKLEFLLAEAQSQRCDYLITCGGAQSNHARATAIVAAKLGMKCHLVLRNGLQIPMEGNLFINRLAGAEIQFVTPKEYMHIGETMRSVASELKSKGHRPYIIVEGGSDVIGSMGYVKAVEEIAGQLKKQKLKIDHIVVPVGSGGTYAGLLAGKYLYDLSTKIHGIIVCENKKYFEKTIGKLINKMIVHHSLPINISASDFHIIDGYVGKGYALSSQSEIDMIKHVACSEGILLDPVYTGKAMLGMADQIKQGVFKREEKVLFLHTGGIFGLFPKKSLFF